MFATPDQNGVAPKCRIDNVSDAYFIATQLATYDLTRDQRRSAVYRCFRGFAPTQYSKLVAKELQTTSNVNWQMMKYRVNNQKSGYIDMVTDRRTVAEIRTKIGNDKEKWEWSQAIGVAYNNAIWDWKSYFPNTEQTLEEMLLYGKGIEIRDEKACWYTRSYHNNQVLIPDRTRTDLSNLEEWAIRDSYKPVEFWRKFKNAKENKNSKWNFWACLDALRTSTGYTNWKTVSNEEYLRRLAAGDINLNRYNFKTIDVYVFFVKEYDESITKYVFLRNYGMLGESRKIEEEEYLNKAGFLYCETNYEKDGWSNILYPFYGACGSGLWHDIDGYATDIYPQCRQYDITTNAQLDALRYSMMIFLKGGNSEETLRLKQMEVGNGLMVLPDGADFAQRAIQVDLRNAEMTKQSIMGDMDRGMANYGMVPHRVEQTAEESRLNFAQENKLDGTELRRYNICQTNWHWGLYSHLVRAKEGWKGYKEFKKFREYLEEAGVPEEAWQPENIEYFDCNFISATGAAKIAALQQVAAIAGTVSTNEGERLAKKMLISSMIGRQNAEAIMPDAPPEMSDQQRIISFENAGLLDPNANPENFQVLPTDNQLEHIRGHFSDAMYTADLTQQAIQSGMADANYVANMGKALLNKGAHLTAHINFLAADKSKKQLVQTIGQQMEVLKGRTDEILAIAAEMAQTAEPEKKSKEELELEYLAAKRSLELEFEEKSNQIKLANKAISHEQQNEARKDKTATDIAIKRARAAVDEEIKRNEATAELAKPTRRKKQDPSVLPDQQ